MNGLSKNLQKIEKIAFGTLFFCDFVTILDSSCGGKMGPRWHQNLKIGVQDDVKTSFKKMSAVSHSTWVKWVCFYKELIHSSGLRGAVLGF